MKNKLKHNEKKFKFAFIRVIRCNDGVNYQKLLKIKYCYVTILAYNYFDLITHFKCFYKLNNDN